MVRRSRRVLVVLLIICAVYAASLLITTYHFFNNNFGNALARDQLRIVAILPNDSNVDNRAIRLEMEEAGKRYGAFVETYETGTAEEQLRVIQIAVDCDADGVLLYPIGKSGYTSALAACKQNEIPVVLISQRLDGAAYDTFIGPEVNSERMAVLSCISATGGTGSLLVVDRLSSGGLLHTEVAVLEPIDHLKQAEVPTATEEFPELKSKISNLVEAPFEGYRVREARVMDADQSSSHSLYTEMYKLLDSQRPAAVFSYDEDVTNVIVACLENANNLPEIYMVGYGNPKESAEQLRNGILDGIVCQKDDYSAFLAVRYLVELRRGESMPTNVDSGIVLISADNLERILAGNEM